MERERGSSRLKGRRLDDFGTDGLFIPIIVILRARLRERGELVSYHNCNNANFQSSHMISIHISTTYDTLIRIVE